MSIFEILVILIKDFENFNNNLTQIKEKLIEESKHKVLKYTSLYNSLTIIANNFHAIFKDFSIKSKEFSVIIQNIIKICKKSLFHMANSLKTVYKNTATKDSKIFEDLQKKHEEYERDLLDSLKFLLLKEKQLALSQTLTVIFLLKPSLPTF